MTIDRIFLVFMAVCGTAAGAILVVEPEAREMRIAPYFWVLIAMGLFELAAYACRRGAPGTTISIEARLLGLVIGVVLMVVLPVLAGSPGKLF
jgi:membrane associated rhomboid family serine protease